MISPTQFLKLLVFLFCFSLGPLFFFADVRFFWLFTRVSEISSGKLFLSTFCILHCSCELYKPFDTSTAFPGLVSKHNLLHCHVLVFVLEQCESPFLEKLSGPNGSEVSTHEVSGRQLVEMGLVEMFHTK